MAAAPHQPFLFPGVELIINHSLMAAAPHQPSPFLAAAYGGDIDVMKRLAQEDGRLINARGSIDDADGDFYSGTTALMIAAASGHDEIVTCLLDNDADMSAKDDGGRDVLFHAASKGRLSNLSMLIERGAKVRKSRTKMV